MTLQEAIEVQTNYLAGGHSVPLKKLEQGMRLGIEAMKRLSDEKSRIPDSLWNLLLGETKD